MNFKNLVFIALQALFVSQAVAAPTLSIIPQGLLAGSWVWEVDITPDLSLVPDSSGTPLAVEMGFRLSSDPLISVTNIDPSKFDTSNPGQKIFGWEVSYPEDNNHPEGIEVNCASCTVTNLGPGHNSTVVSGSANEIFSAMGTINFTLPGPKPFLQIIAQGPGTGGPNSSTIEWLGKYGDGNAQGLIVQINGGTPGGPYTTGNYFFSGSATQTIPEPVTATLASTGMLAGLMFIRRRR
jgi:hypothetical protein